MNRPPRDPKEPLFSRRVLLLTFLQGLSVLAMVLAVYLVALYRGQGEEDARTLTFTSLIVANIALILTNRSWSSTVLGTLKKPNTAFWWVAGGAVLFLALVLYVRFLRSLFHFNPLHPLDLVLCLASGVAGISWFEILKVLRLRGQHSSS